MSWSCCKISMFYSVSGKLPGCPPGVYSQPHIGECKSHSGSAFWTVSLVWGCYSKEEALLGYNNLKIKMVPFLYKRIWAYLNCLSLSFVLLQPACDCFIYLVFMLLRFPGSKSLQFQFIQHTYTVENKLLWMMKELLWNNQMEKRRIDEYEPGPVPPLRPLDRFGFIKEEVNHTPESLNKVRSANYHER